MPTMIFALAALLFGRIPLLAFALVIGGVFLFLFVWALLVDRPRQKKLARLVEDTLRK
jgi:Flp pilus assembly protein TadB